MTKFKKKYEPIEGEIWDPTIELTGLIKQAVTIVKHGKWVPIKEKYFLKTNKGEISLKEGDLVIGTSPHYKVVTSESLNADYEEDIS